MNEFNSTPNFAVRNDFGGQSMDNNEGNFGEEEIRRTGTVVEGNLNEDNTLFGGNVMNNNLSLPNAQPVQNPFKPDPVTNPFFQQTIQFSTTDSEEESNEESYEEEDQNEGQKAFFKMFPFEFLMDDSEIKDDIRKYD